MAGGQESLSSANKAGAIQEDDIQEDDDTSGAVLEEGPAIRDVHTERWGKAEEHVLA